MTASGEIQSFNVDDVRLQLHQIVARIPLEGQSMTRCRPGALAAD
jgi:hypothetical protein